MRRWLDLAVLVGLVALALFVAMALEGTTLATVAKGLSLKLRGFIT